VVVVVWEEALVSKSTPTSNAFIFIFIVDGDDKDEEGELSPPVRECRLRWLLWWRE
jgi:hypothetical protein